MAKVILVLDGHDGVGKTTLALRLAQAVGGLYIQPFSGASGASLLDAAERGDNAYANELARGLVQHALAGSNAPVLICDRHWMTIFTLLPEAFWSQWQPLPPTMLCWANIDTILNRLAQRHAEVQHTRTYHINYMRRYWALGQRFGCPLLQTDHLSIEASLEHLTSWAKSHIGG